MRINGNAVRPGMMIEHNGELWVAVKIQHTQPGKGGAYLQVELKNLNTGSKLNERFRSSESVERVRLDQKEHQFLFADENMLTFMDTETYDQTQLSSDLVGDPAVFLQDGMIVTIESYEGSPIRVEVPESVVVAVTETEPTVRGQTAAAILQTRNPREWRPYHGAAFHRGGRPDRRKHRRRKLRETGRGLGCGVGR